MAPSLLRLVAAAVLAAGVLAGAAPASAEGVVIVVNRIIYPGETIGPDAIEEVAFAPAKPLTSPVATLAEDVEGKVARRTLLPGKLIPVSSLREPFLVQAGSPVAVLFVQGGLTIAATAVPLEPGAIGAVVKLRNIDSGKVFSGIVMADGTVRVGAT
ncbi:MAG: flagellar basal body P-ring formation chaperone FlgA [Mesorhizobium sp.]|nr:flagellar basal body P-ring formation chaperone FlgA [Mesorhizobium sp.]